MPRIPSRDLNRADRRALIGSDVHNAGGLAVTRLGNAVYIGIVNGGRCRLTPDEADKLAADLIDLADETRGATTHFHRLGNETLDPQTPADSPPQSTCDDPPTHPA